MHIKMSFMMIMLIKTRLILNDVTWTLSSCVSITARFIKENIQERSTIKDVMLNSALMLLVNPLMVFSGLYVYRYFK